MHRLFTPGRLQLGPRTCFALLGSPVGFAKNIVVRLTRFLKFHKQNSFYFGQVKMRLYKLTNASWQTWECFAFTLCYIILIFMNILYVFLPLYKKEESVFKGMKAHILLSSLVKRHLKCTSNSLVPKSVKTVLEIIHKMYQTSTKHKLRWPVDLLVVRGRSLKGTVETSIKQTRCHTDRTG